MVVRQRERGAGRGTLPRRSRGRCCWIWPTTFPPSYPSCSSPGRACRVARRAAALRAEVRGAGPDRPGVEALHGARSQVDAALGRPLAREAHVGALAPPDAAGPPPAAAERGRGGGDLAGLARRRASISIVS